MEKSPRGRGAVSKVDHCSRVHNIKAWDPCVDSSKHWGVSQRCTGDQGARRSSEEAEDRAGYSAAERWPGTCKAGCSPAPHTHTAEDSGNSRYVKAMEVWVQPFVNAFLIQDIFKSYRVNNIVWKNVTREECWSHGCLKWSWCGTMRCCSPWSNKHQVTVSSTWALWKSWWITFHNTKIWSELVVLSLTYAFIYYKNTLRARAQSTEWT